MEIPKNWTFKSEEIAANFDQHVREQLPWYDLTTGIVAHVGRHYIPQNGNVYDIGASTGNIGKAIAGTLTARSATFTAIESSKEMADRYSGPGTLEIADATEYPFLMFDFAVCFLVLSFIPHLKRKALLSVLRERIKQGGALIVFDKCKPCGGYVSTVMSRLALAGKMAAGVDARQILDKELSLSGVQRPLNPTELIGATEIFRFGDFAGWIIEGES